MNKKTANSFTLVELLVVISVLGILAAITYRVIDVQGVRNRARDSNVYTASEKIALSVEAHIAAKGQSPDGLEFTSLIDGLTVLNGCQEGDPYCVFAITGFNLPLVCGSSGYRDSGTDQCYFYYYSYRKSSMPVPERVADYVILTRSWGKQDRAIGYRSTLHIPSGDNLESGNIECGLNAFGLQPTYDPKLGDCELVIN